MSESYSRSGVRRSGDDYQDVVALDYLVEWLEHPTRYVFARIEADDAGFLDDVVLQRADGSLDLYQVKFSAHPDAAEDPWSFPILLAEKPTPKGTRPSLLAKWAQSLRSTLKEHSVRQATIVSNRRPNHDLATCLDAFGALRIELIANPETRLAVEQTLAGEGGPETILSRLRFQLDRPNLSDLEEAVFARFRRLGGTEKGWLHLKDELRSWVRNRNLPEVDGRIRLQHIKRAALWSTPRAIDQEFVIPDDYVSPSTDFADALEAQIKDPQKACIVLTARPGVGKSTFLSALVRDRRERQQPVIRHHYFLSSGDRSDRLDAERVIESLMAELATQYGDAISGVSASNPMPGEFPAWLEAAGQYFLAHGERLVVIIDGLDHVWRDTGSHHDLDRLFRRLLPPSPGVCVLVGSQPLPDEQLPRSLVVAAPRAGWLEVPCLDKEALRVWVGHHRKDLAISDNEYAKEHQINELAEAFLETTSGYPLLLNYAIRTLTAEGGHITDTRIRAMPRCPEQDIASYYQVLWRSLSDLGRDILLLFVASDFPWRTTWIHDCLDPDGRKSIAIAEGLRHIQYLLQETAAGWTPFHSSLTAYLSTLPDYAGAILSLKRAVLAWLRHLAPEYLRLGNEWLIEADLGEINNLATLPSRAWVLKLLAIGAPRYRVETVISRAMEVVLAQNDIPRHAELCLLLDYFGIVQDFYIEAREQLLDAQLYLDADGELFRDLLSRLHGLSELQLIALARRAYKLEDFGAVEQIVDSLVRQHGSPRIERRDMEYGGWNRTTGALLCGVALSSELGPDRITQFADRIRSTGRAFDIIHEYAQELRVWHRTATLNELASLSLDLPERMAVSQQLVLNSFEQDVLIESTFDLSTWGNDPWIFIYTNLRGVSPTIDGELDFPSIEDFVPKTTVEAENLVGFEQACNRAFYAFLANHLRNHGQANLVWLQNVPGPSWRLEFVTALNEIAASVAPALRNGQPVSVASMYLGLTGLETLDIEREHTPVRYPESIGRCMRSIVLDLLSLSFRLSGSVQVTEQDLRSASQSLFWDCDAWILDIARLGRAWLSPEAVRYVISAEETKLASSVSEFPSRAQRFAVMARLAGQYQFSGIAKDLVDAAADNLLAYGPHKDIFLHGLLEILKCCFDAGLSETHSWLSRLAPALVRVREYTDGDETSHLPSAFSSLLGRMDIGALQRHYLWLLAKRDYDAASDVFPILVREIDLADSFAQAIVSTGVDTESLSELRIRAAKGDQLAATVADQLAIYGDGNDPTASRPSYTSSPSELASGDISRLSDPSLYPIDQFSIYMEEHSDDYRSNALLRWIDYWVNRGELDKVLDTIVTFEYRGGWVRDCFDLLYKIVKERRGNEAAYPWLIRAHNDARGWFEYWTDPAASEARLYELRTMHEDRIPDFLQKTLKGQFGVYRSPLRLVNFFFSIDQTDVVKNFVERVISFACDLVSPVKDTLVVDWPETPIDAESLSLSVLLARLSWPSGMVRERACVALAECLEQPSLNTKVCQALVEWIAQQALESNCAFGLLPFLRARVVLKSPQLPTMKVVQDHLARPSLLSILLVEKLGGTRSDLVSVLKQHSGDFPAGFTPPRFFEKYCDAFIMPLYRTSLDRWSKSSGKALIRQWAYEWQCLVGRLGISPSTSELHFRGLREESDHFGLFDSLLSEVFRSAFLRTLHWACDGGIMSIQDGVFFALLACPVNLDLWRSSFTQLPDWWFGLNKLSDGTDPTSVDIHEPVRDWLANLPSQLEGFLPGHASGRIHEGQTVHEIQLQAVLQQTQGTTSLDVNNSLLRCDYYEPGRFQGSAPFLEGKYLARESENSFFKDEPSKWIPLSVRIESFHHPWWQSYRVERGVWMPSPFLGSGSYFVQLEDGTLRACDFRGVLGYWQSWSYQLLEKRRANLPSSTGQCLLLNPDRVKTLAERLDASLVWLVSHSVFQRKDNLEFFKITDHCFVIESTTTSASG